MMLYFIHIHLCPFFIHSHIAGTSYNAIATTNKYIIPFIQANHNNAILFWDTMRQIITSIPTTIDKPYYSIAYTLSYLEENFDLKTHLEQHITLFRHQHQQHSPLQEPHQLQPPTLPPSHLFQLTN